MIASNTFCRPVGTSAPSAPARMRRVANQATTRITAIVIHIVSIELVSVNGPKWPSGSAAALTCG